MVWLLFLYTTNIVASSPDYYYKQLNVEQGLSQSRVQCILYDYKGYMWVGTQWGLNCYDRDVLKTFFHEENNPYSLPSNDILFIVEDQQKNLWIGTREGLCLYDREEARFRRIAYDGQLLRVFSFVLLNDGILFGSIGEMYKYEYGSKQIDRLPIKRETTTYSSFINLQKLNENTIIANTRWFGIYQYNLSTTELRRVDYVKESNIASLFIDSHNRIWASSYGTGLYCYQNGELIRHFNSRNSPLTYDVILAMEEKDGYLWLGTDGGGINLISLEDFSFEQVIQIKDNISSFPSNAIYSLYKDPMNNMWAGSIRDGLIGIREVHAKSFGKVPFHNPYGLSNRTVNRIFQDSDGLMWIGTDGGGVNCYNPQNMTFKHYSTTRLEKVTSILEYSKQELLLFLFNKGLFYFNKATGALRPFIIINEEINRDICINGYSVFISSISQDKIMISAEQIFIYDKRTKQFKIIASKDREYLRNSPLIKQSGDGKTYVVDLYNIYEYIPETNELITRYQEKEEIYDMCIGSNNNLWIGTNNGLFYYNPQTKDREQIQTDLFQGVNSVVADKEEHIWIGTKANLLFSYTIATGQFALLGESDGIIPNEYLFDAMLVSESGDIYTGGTLGMSLINRNIPIADNTQSSIVLTDILVNGAAVKEDIEQACPAISVPWNFSTMQLKIMVRENDIFRKDVFRYYIKGENTTTELKSFNYSITLNNLPTGTYTIAVSHIAPNGEWSEPTDVANIHITPPWWKTNSFIGLCIAVLVAITLGIFYWIYKKKKKKQMQELERLKEKIYEDKIRFLTNISHELRTPLTLICSPLKRILDANCQVDTLQQQLISIYKQSLQMKDTIDMVLDVRKLEEKKEVLNITLAPFNEWIRTTASQFEDELTCKHIQLVYRLDERIGQVLFDKHKCKSVLCNLLMNALKFSETHTTIILTSMLIDNAVRVEVKDQGMGLEPVDISQLFTLYYQGEHEKSGSGIGLSYAKALIDLHHGKIGATNNPDTGATFYFELPLDNEQTGSDSTENPIEYPFVNTDFSELKTYSVLIIEDVNDLRNYLKNALSEYFNRIYTAKDGVEGLIMVKQQSPDIIISDVMMPRMDGFRLCSTIKSDIRISHIPVILLTAYNNPANMSTGYKLGADAFLGKPFDLDILLSLINNQLTLRKSIKTRYNNSMISEKDITFSNADETFLEKLNSIIHKEMENPDLDVALLTNEMGVSRSLLFNKIKVLTDMGIVDYVNKCRIDKAIHLLNHSSMNITEISEKVGFSTPRYFSRVFKQLTGKIPSQHRNKEEESCSEL